MNKVVKIILIGVVVVNGCAGAYLAMNPDRIPKKETVATSKRYCHDEPRFVMFSFAINAPFHAQILTLSVFYCLLV